MELVYALQSAASPALDRLMMAVTQLGSETVYIALIVVVFTGVDAQRGRSLALLLLASFYVNQVLKLAFTTQRPFQVDPEVLRSPAAADTAPGHGFPSGHAQGSATFWGVAATYVKRNGFTVLALAIVLGVSVSRVYLGVHMPIDILGGWFVAALFVALAVWLRRSRFSFGKSLTIGLGFGLPLALQLTLPNDMSGMLLGCFAAFAVGPEIVRHEAGGTLVQRVLLCALALALAFGALMGSSVALPEELKRLPLVAFTRYFVIGAVVTVAMPLLGRRLGLAPGATRAAVAASRAR